MELVEAEADEGAASSSWRASCVMGRCTSTWVTVTHAPANPIRRLARHTPAPLDGVVEYGAGVLDDLTEIVEGLPDDPLDAWDPEHIRRTLPLLHAINAAYFRPDVRGLENIPAASPRCSSATTPAA